MRFVLALISVSCLFVSEAAFSQPTKTVTLPVKSKTPPTKGAGQEVQAQQPPTCPAGTVVYGDSCKKPSEICTAPQGTGLWQGGKCVVGARP